MPGKVYTNADVQRMLGKSPKPTDMEVIKQIPKPITQLHGVETQTIDSRMAGAKAALERAYSHGDMSDLLSIDGRLQELADRPKPSLRGAITATTEGMSHVGQAAGLAAMVPGPQQALLGAIAMPLMAPNAARHLLMPNEDETRWGGAAEVGLDLAASYGGSALGKLWQKVRGGASAAKPAMNWGKLAEANSIQRATRVPGEELTDVISHEVPYAMSPSAPMPKAAKPAVDTSGFPNSWQEFVGTPKPKPPYVPKGNGKAAQDVYKGVDRRVDPSGKLPFGMTDRRLDEIHKSFGFGK